MKNKIFIKQIKKFIKKKINKILNKHNGSLKFISIDKNNNIVLKFKGNCNICNFKKNTFINLILNNLKNNFPEINNINYI